ncbi:hypothetical protein ASPCAL10028 [Aspergillus calidoustus]|uniref:F-box domain-containing protein n=1 Tax=Aspergillus calidoustus TaxID=454130 RepID=A0A0U5CBU0_ASPCI|nr:hypothetical protein ASPCAL10028 [Aspergillus calidoustus]
MSSAEHTQDPILTPLSFTTTSPQPTSPLFSTLPPELRHQIFTYTLTQCEDTDPSHAYNRETYWARPGYSAPLKTHTALLRTCKLAYAEGWWMPLAFAEQVFYLTADERAPPRIGGGRIERRAFEGFLKHIHEMHARRGMSEMQMHTGPLHIFAQLYMLEPGSALQDLFDIEHFAPRSVTLTLRYTDFWHWERNEPLRVSATWVNRVRFPESVVRFVVDFESVERRKGEVDCIVGQAVAGWVFRRRDGGVLRATAQDVSVSRWSGSSMFGGRRWVRDETPDRPGVLDYYVVSVVWRLDRSSLRPGPDPGLAQEEEEEEGGCEECLSIQVPYDFVQVSPPLSGWTSLSENELRMAGVGMDVPAEEAVEAVRTFRTNSVATRARSRSLARGLRMGGVMRRGGGDLI